MKIKHYLIFGILLCTTLSSAKIITKNDCLKNESNFIYSGGECIEFVKFDGDVENQLNIIVHGTWKEGTNTIGRYKTFAEDISLNTDITTIAIALPGYSNSSTNSLKSLDNKIIKNIGATKEYVNFMSTLIKDLKTKFRSEIINYIGHSAGAMIGATVTGYSPGIINNMVSVGGIYNIHKKIKNNNLISIIDKIDNIDKKTKFLLIYGTNDKISLPKITKEFYKIAKNKKINAKIVEVKDAAHIDLDMTSTSIDAITNFLE